MPKSFVYILRSLNDEKHYIGHTSDLNKRLKRHNCGDSKSTKSRGKFSVVYYEEKQSLIKAVKAEKQIKSLGVKRFLNSG